MAYEAELNYLKKLLMQFHLNMHLVSDIDHMDDLIDLGLRTFLGLEDDYERSFHSFLHRAQPNTVYKISDDFFCSYVVLLLPDDYNSKKTFLIIGPYTEQDFSKQDIWKAIEKYHIPPKLTERLIQYYAGITLLTDSSVISAIFTAFAETIWGNTDNYTVKTIRHSLSEKYIDSIPDTISDFIPESKDIAFKMELLEKRYEAENRFIKNISQGNYHKAELSFESSTLFDIEKRLADPVRNFKNYCITMNTLLRKAAESGMVHPIHIDRISSGFAKKIEAITSTENGKKLMREMIRKYGLLVKNYSLKDYSLLIQKVITRVESDLTADQTLNAHAQLLNVSPSYLSTLFRKEVGITLTEYVNRKRIEYGVMLLNTTNMQIQTIAQHCGISDINYFTRIFKKQIGKTPKEYRNSIGH